MIHIILRKTTTVQQHSDMYKRQQFKSINEKENISLKLALKEKNKTQQQKQKAM